MHEMARQSNYQHAEGGYVGYQMPGDLQIDGSRQYNEADIHQAASREMPPDQGSMHSALQSGKSGAGVQSGNASQISEYPSFLKRLRLGIEETEHKKQKYKQWETN
jgi:hypothetical protein